MRDPTTFAGRLALALTVDPRTQGEIATAAGVQEDQLSRWKNGKATPELASVVALLGVLHISGHWLLTGEGGMVPEPDAESQALRLDVIGRIAAGTLDDDAIRHLAGFSPAEAVSRAAMLEHLWGLLGQGPHQRVGGSRS